MTAKLLVRFVRGYQLLLSPYFGGSCRFLPTCSCYAIEAIETHGALRGTWLALRRLGRCHPLGRSGFDPVPSAFAAAPLRRDEATATSGPRREKPVSV